MRRPGLVVPTGYSFNLDGAAIYLSISLLFLAQAFGHNLDLGQQLAALGVLLLTSKGMAGVPGLIVPGTLRHRRSPWHLPGGRRRPAPRR